MKRANQIFILSLLLGIMLLSFCSAFSLSDWLRDLFGKNSYSISGGNCLCSSCSSCNFALKDSSCSSIKLANDITFNSGYCLLANQENKIIDCQNYKISNQNSKGIGIYIKANNINVSNCYFSDLRRGIFVLNSRGISLTNLNLNRTTDSSISLKDSQTNLNNVAVYSGLNGILIKNSNVNLNNIFACRKSSAGKDIFVESSSIIKNNISCDSSQGVSCDKSCSLSPSGCAESWICTAWSACSYDFSKHPPVSRTRTCRDTNNCGTTLNKPDETIRTASCCDESINPRCRGEYLETITRYVNCSEKTERVFCPDGCVNYKCVIYSYSQYTSSSREYPFDPIFRYSSSDGKNRIAYKLEEYLPYDPDPEVELKPIYSTYYYLSNDYGQTWKQIINCSGCYSNMFYSGAVFTNNSYFLISMNTMDNKIQYPRRFKQVFANSSFRGYYSGADLDSSSYSFPIISPDGKFMLYKTSASSLSSQLAELVLSKDYGKTWRTILTDPLERTYQYTAFKKFGPIGISSDGKIIFAVLYETSVINRSTGNQYFSPRKIYVSNDSGNSFSTVFEVPLYLDLTDQTVVSSWPSYSVISSIADFSMSDDGRVQAFLSQKKYLINSEEGANTLELLVSKDYGKTWSNKINYTCENNWNTCGFSPGHTDVFVSSDGSKIIFYAGKKDNTRQIGISVLSDSENKVLISTDSGDNFNSIYEQNSESSESYLIIKASSDFNKIILVNKTNLLISNDYGQNWRIVPGFCPGCEYNIFGWDHYIDYVPVFTYIVSSDGNYISFPNGVLDVYSNDGGLTWNKRQTMDVYTWA